MAGKIEAIQHKVICAFRDIRGIDAIVLGGSRVTGTAGPQSDLDIGLYYNHTSLDIESLKQKAAMLDDERRDHVLTNPGEWGPWINGGGWLRINGLSVDILYRSSSRVAEVIDSCMHGTIDIDYQCGHPFGFVSSIYLGEVAYCQILHSNSSIVSDLKAKLVHFPETYQKAAIEKFLWECSFSLSCGRKAIHKGDILYAAGSLYRSANCLIQVLAAYNGLYILNEKNSLARLQLLKGAYLPDRFIEDVESVFTHLSKSRMEDCFNLLQMQHDEIVRAIKP